MTVKILSLIAFFFLSTVSSAQSESNNEDSCKTLYAQGGDLHLSFNVDSLHKALGTFDKVLSGNCSTEMKNFCRYNKAQTLSKLDRDKEALKLLKEALYTEADSNFLAYIYQEIFFIYRKIGKNSKALKAINKALELKSNDNEFHYRKTLVLFDLQEYSAVLKQLSKINYRAPYLLIINALTLISAFKAEDFELSLRASKFILGNEEKYGEQTLNSAKLVSILITRNDRSLNEEEKRQLDSLKLMNIDPSLKKEMK